MTKESKKSKPFYGVKTKKRVIQEFFYSSASMKELSEIHGILGSNTVSDWLRKYGNLRPRKFSNTPIMTKPHASFEDKKYRKKRYKTNEQLYLSDLENELQIALQRVHFYSTAIDVINELALELIGIDLLKKTGSELSKRSQKREL